MCNSLVKASGVPLFLALGPTLKLERFFWGAPQGQLTIFDLRFTMAIIVEIIDRDFTKKIRSLLIKVSRQHSVT